MVREASIQGKAALAQNSGIDAQRRRGFVVAAAVLALAFAAGALYFALARPVQVLPRVQEVPPFDLIDQHGASYQYPDRALPVNVFIVAAAWDTEAHASIARMLGQLDGLLAERGWRDQVQVAWLTPDPERDGVAAMAALADEGLWPEELDVALLTGTPVTVRLVVGGAFGIFVGANPSAHGGVADGVAQAAAAPAPAPQAPSITYEPTLVLVDNQGWVRSRYTVRHVSETKLARDIWLMVTEGQAEGANRLVYEAAHLFLCYPR